MRMRRQDYEHVMEKPGISNTSTITEQLGKVAAVGLSFWILKVLTTTVGDLCGDVLSITLGLGYVNALIVALAAIGALLVVQLSARRFHLVLYWALVFISSTVGAEFSDTVDRALHWGTLAGAGVLLVCLVITLGTWYVLRGEIGVYPIKERVDEGFYWLAVIFANSLGSVLGDLLGDRLGLGVLGGVAVNAGVLAVLALLHFRTRVSKGLLFWTAFVFSRVSF